MDVNHIFFPLLGRFSFNFYFFSLIFFCNLSFISFFLVLIMINCYTITTTTKKEKKRKILLIIRGLPQPTTGSCFWRQFNTALDEATYGSFVWWSAGIIIKHFMTFCFTRFLLNTFHGRSFTILMNFSFGVTNKRKPNCCFDFKQPNKELPTCLSTSKIN